MTDGSLASAHGVSPPAHRPLTIDHQPAGSDRLLDVDGIARALGVSRTTIYRMVDRRELPFFRVGHALRFALPDVKRHLAAGPNLPPL